MNRNLSPIKGRILYFIEKQNITKKFFCEKSGISYSNIRSKAMESEFNLSSIDKILSSFPEINERWLLTGEGEMLKSSAEEKKETQSQILSQKYMAALERCNELHEKNSKLQEEIAELKVENERLRNDFSSAATDPFVGKGCKAG